jgi:hypothetical protein
MVVSASPAMMKAGIGAPIEATGLGRRRVVPDALNQRWDICAALDIPEIDPVRAGGVVHVRLTGGDPPLFQKPSI